MFSRKLNALCFILEIVSHIFALVELPPVKDNILEPEFVIRDVTEKIFSTLNLNRIKKQPRLHQYSSVYNYLTSLGLQDSINLKEIAKLTRVDKGKINNETWHFMTAINEVLNDDNVEAESNDEDVLRHIELFLNNLKNYRANNVDESHLNIYDDIVKPFKEENFDADNNTQENIDSVETSDNDTLSESEFWEPSGRRIYKGTRIKIKYFPFMASIRVFNNFQCGGSIISSDLILSAASCLQLAYNNRFFRENPAFLTVRVGSTHYNGGGEIIAVSEVYFHPGYNPKNLRNNICLMRLVRHIKFKRKEKRIKKIDFDRHASALPMTTNGITVLGWGSRQTSNIIHDPQLSYAVLDVYPLRECQDVYSREYVTQKNFCAGFFSRGGGACNRDVGGPGVVNGILTGIISFGSPMCGTADAPTVFTKVGYYTDWIEEIMEQEVPVAKQRTTLKPPHTIYSSVFHTAPPKTTFKIEPPSGPMTHVPLTEVDTLRILSDSTLFKQFLKTMFNSNEIENYKDLLEDETVTLERSVKDESLTVPTTEIKEYTKETTEPIRYEPATIMGPVDPNFVSPIIDTESSVETAETQELNIEIKEPELSIEIKAPPVEAVAEQPKDLEKELEQGIVKLIDNMNIKDFVQEPTNEPNDELLDYKDLVPLVQDTQKEAKLKDNDNSVLTVLYLSGDEKRGGAGTTTKKHLKKKKLKKSKHFKDMTMRNNSTKHVEKNTLMDLLSEAFRAEFGNITLL